MNLYCFRGENEESSTTSNSNSNSNNVPVERHSWITNKRVQLCRNPVVDSAIVEPCESLTTDGFF